MNTADLLPILPYYHPMMVEPSRPVEQTDDVAELAQRMLNTMAVCGGAGLAAVQTGHPLRMFTMVDLPNTPTLPVEGVAGLARFVLINPEYTYCSDEMIEHQEGCLSMPGVFFAIPRHAEVTLKYHDLTGAEKTMHASGYRAICIQHEMDHLSGKRNIDHLSRLKREKAEKKFATHVRQQQAIMAQRAR